jgi:hypothetical protein
VTKFTISVQLDTVHANVPHTKYQKVCCLLGVRVNAHADAQPCSPPHHTRYTIRRKIACCVLSSVRHLVLLDTEFHLCRAGWVDSRERTATLRWLAPDREDPSL